MRKAKPKEAGQILKSTLKYLRLDKQLERYQGFSDWENIVGAEVAQVSMPKQISKTGVLSVEVLDSAWGQELNMKKLELLEAYNANPHTTTINDIRFIATDPKKFSKAK